MKDKKKSLEKPVKNIIEEEASMSKDVFNLILSRVRNSDKNLFGKGKRFKDVDDAYDSLRDREL